MAKKRKAKKRLAGRSNHSLDYHTASLLRHLNEQREQLGRQLQNIDERINMLSTWVGTSATAARPTPSRSAAGRSRAKGRRGPRGAIAGSILKAIGNRSLAIPDIVTKTGLARGQVYPSLMALKKEGKVKAKARGIYVVTAKGQSAAKSLTATPKAKAPKPASSGSSGLAVVNALKRKGPLDKDQIARATGLTRRQVHACLMSLKRGKSVAGNAKGVFKLTKKV